MLLGISREIIKNVLISEAQIEKLKGQIRYKVKEHSGLKILKGFAKYR